MFRNTYHGLTSNTILPAGNYKVYHVFYMAHNGTPSQISRWAGVYLEEATIYGPSFNIVPVFEPKCEISSYGFRYFVDSDKYVEFTKNGDFKIQHGNSQFYLSDDNIYMGFNGGTALNVVPVKQKVRVYKNYKATVDGVQRTNTGRWMITTLLTLGDIAYEDNDE